MSDKPPSSFLEHANALKESSKPILSEVKTTKKPTEDTPNSLEPKEDDYIAFGISKRPRDTFYRLEIRYKNRDSDAFLYADFDIKHRPSKGKIILDFRGSNTPSIELHGRNLEAGFRALCEHRVKYIQELGEYYHREINDDEICIEEVIRLDTDDRS